MGNEPSGLVPRYLYTQRLIHWIGVASFLVLLASGMALLFPPISFLAAGGFSRHIHQLAAIPFVALPFVYAILLPAQTKELLGESFAYTRDDWEWFKHMPAYLLGRTHGLPPQGRLNAGQKLHHASTFLMFVTVSASGFVLWFGKGRLGADGLASTAMAHDLSMLGLSLLMIGHIYFTFLYDAFSAMRTGFVTEEYARMEHARWFAALPRASSDVAPETIGEMQAARGASGSAGVPPADPNATTVPSDDTKISSP